MKIHDNIDALPVFRNAVITVGAFDGVHKGHLHIIDQLKKEAEAINGETVIITFHPHPRLVLQPTGESATLLKPVHLLNTLSEKIELLHAHNIDHLVVVPFTEEFSNIQAEDYIQEFLVKKFQPKIIITGYDHHFGKNRRGNFAMLERFKDRYGYHVREIPKQVLHDVSISSTKVRTALLKGDIETATEFLGYDYFFAGQVIYGNQLGKKLGYPTANLLLENQYKLIPGSGIYIIAASLAIPGQKPDERFISESVHDGMLSIGLRPTIGDDKFMIEAHLLNFSGHIYGRRLRIYVKKYLRPELKLNSLEELILQMDQDKVDTQKYLAQAHKQNI